MIYQLVRAAKNPDMNMIPFPMIPENHFNLKSDGMKATQGWFSPWLNLASLKVDIGIRQSFPDIVQLRLG